MNTIQRPGVDHDPVRPWVWATIPMVSHPVEIVSYPIPPHPSTGEVDRFGFDKGTTIVIRTMPGDPTSIREIPFRMVACFDPDRHEWAERPRRYYSDNPTAFIFSDVVEDATLADAPPPSPTYTDLMAAMDFMASELGALALYGTMERRERAIMSALEKGARNILAKCRDGTPAPGAFRDLLEVLESMLEFFDHGTPVHPGALVVEDARAAVAKAREVRR